MVSTVHTGVFQCVCLGVECVCWGGGQVEGLVGKVAGVRTMIAASKRGLHGFPLSSCTCHYGITDATSTFSYLRTHTGSKPRRGRGRGWSCLGQQVECSSTEAACWSWTGTHSEHLIGVVMDATPTQHNLNPPYAHKHTHKCLINCIHRYTHEHKTDKFNYRPAAIHNCSHSVDTDTQTDTHCMREGKKNEWSYDCPRTHIHPPSQ